MSSYKMTTIRDPSGAIPALVAAVVVVVAFIYLVLLILR
jgi:hypothetical protein